MKYRVKPEVNGFRYKGRRYHPGETVDMPEGAHIPPFLEVVEEGKPEKPEAKPSSLATSIEDLERQDLLKARGEQGAQPGKKPRKVKADA